MIPFSLLWGGAAVSGEIMAVHVTFFAVKGRPPIGFALIIQLVCISFAIFGLYMIFGRFIVDTKRRSKTFYGLTNQKIIVVSGLLSRKVRSIDLRTISDISLAEKSDHTGDITFGPSHPKSWWAKSTSRFFGDISLPGTPQFGPSFEMIQDARGVYEQIREAQSKA